jgi:organic hydroperoxide reductase OsmC/OhrA
MMGTLAAVLAGNKISTSQNKYRAEVKGEIESVDGVLKITRIHIQYFLSVVDDQKNDAQNCLNNYLSMCPGAQSVIGCIEISHAMTFEQM